MRSFERVRRELLQLARPPGRETVPTQAAAGRVLQADVVARLDDPAEARSAMDGYAVYSGDLARADRNAPVHLVEAGLLPAGRRRAQKLRRGEAMRIMTGAPLPTGADAVVPVEKVRVRAGRVRFEARVRPSAHVRHAGENFAAGDLLLKKQAVLRPQEVGLCITAGLAKLPVARRVRVAVLSTGSELVPPGARRRRGEVYDSNRPMILAQVEATGAEPIDLGTIDDRLSRLADRLKVARRQADFLITLGGVSAGDFDIVKLFLQRHRSLRRVQVAMRPARPQAFGRLGRLFWYALPGNPVSAWVAFDQLVRPLLLRSMGHLWVLRPLRLGVAQEFSRSVRGLVDFVRAQAEPHAGLWRVRQVGPEGSSNLRSLVEANALMVVPPDRDRVEPGSPVPFELLTDPPTGG